MFRTEFSPPISQLRFSSEFSISAPSWRLPSDSRSLRRLSPVKISVDPDQPRDFTVYVRVPGWTGNQVMAGDLYRFLGTNRSPVILKVNGRTINPTMANGYAKIKREWKAGDSVELSLPMPVRRILADSRVKDDAGRVALERGPLVYCTEWAARSLPVSISIEELPLCRRRHRAQEALVPHWCKYRMRSPRARVARTPRRE